MLPVGRWCSGSRTVIPDRCSLMKPCLVPPKGWKCTRGAGHDGPCAAIEDNMKKAYAYHKPSPAGLAIIKTIRNAFSQLHETLDTLCPNSREKSVALTNLETTAMWAIKSVVCNDPNSEVE
jgi:hypothetical protein